MASRRITIHDLTSDSSSDENSPVTATKPSLPSLQSIRNPFSAIQNNAQPVTKCLSPVLKMALATLSESRVRSELELLLSQHDAARYELERRLLVKGCEVVRYHEDIESENEKEDEGEDEEREVRLQQRPERSFPIAIADEEWTPRFAKCDNCKEEFDVTDNEERECYWHTRRKQVNYDSDYWADHDENCHGPYESYEDDPEAQEGFTWPCCENSGDHEGCMVTKHKAKVNVPSKDVPSLPTSNKRKAEEEMSRPATHARIS